MQVKGVHLLLATFYYQSDTTKDARVQQNKDKL